MDNQFGWKYLKKESPIFKNGILDNGWEFTFTFFSRQGAGYKAVMH